MILQQKLSLWITWEKFFKKCNELSPKPKLAFSNVIVRKDKVNLERGRKDINSGMKNFRQRKGIGYIDNNNITENYLGMKKLHLNSKGKTAFAKNMINFIENWHENSENLDFIEEPSSAKIYSTDCKSKSPISRDSDESNSLKEFCELYPNKIKIAHINKNSIKISKVCFQIKWKETLIFWWFPNLKLRKVFRYVNSKLMYLIHLFELIGTTKVVA